MVPDSGMPDGICFYKSGIPHSEVWKLLVYIKLLPLRLSVSNIFFYLYVYEK